MRTQRSTSGSSAAGLGAGLSERVVAVRGTAAVMLATAGAVCVAATSGAEPAWAAAPDVRTGSRVCGEEVPKLPKIMNHVRLLAERFFSGEANLAHAVDADDLDQDLFAFFDHVRDVLYVLVGQLTDVD